MAIPPIVTTVSQGRLHIALDLQYIGSVDVYQSIFSRCVAKMTYRSIDIDFDGQIYTVNRQSFQDLTASLRKKTVEEKTQELSQCCIFRSMLDQVELPQNGSMRMRDMISPAQKQIYFQELAKAISKGDTETAVSMIRKGATLDSTYLDRSGLEPSFSEDTVGLSLGTRYDFIVFEASPFLQAAKKGNKVVCEFLQKAGANPSLPGVEYHFTREIIETQTTGKIERIDIKWPIIVTIPSTAGDTKSGVTTYSQEIVRTPATIVVKIRDQRYERYLCTFEPREGKMTKRPASLA